MSNKLLLIAATIFAIGVSLIGPDVAHSKPPEKVEVLITFDRTPGPDEEDFVREKGGKIKRSFHLVPGIAATVPETAISGLMNNPHIKTIEPDVTFDALDVELDSSWGVKHIGAGLVHILGNKGAGVKIAVIDSGIDDTHPELAGKVKGGWDFVNENDDTMDYFGHGTHVAGIIAAADDDFGVVGVAPEAWLYALKAIGPPGKGKASDVIAALEWSVDNGIQITNNSYGMPNYPGTLVQAAYDNSYAFGIIHIAAAGNNGNTPGKGNSVLYPARFDSVIAVGATDPADSRPRFSSTGPAVELAAPGVNVLSTFLGGAYVPMSGTSMASPHVVGTAALIIASLTVTDTDDENGIANEVRDRLNTTADDLGTPGRDVQYGFGLVDADEAAAPVE